MPINLKTPVVESREQRLGTIVGWDGTASELARQSAYARGCGSGEGKGCGQKARRICELEGPFTQGSVCSEMMVENQAGHILDAVLIQHAPIGCGAGQVSYNLRFRNGLAARHKPVQNIHLICTNLTCVRRLRSGGQSMEKSAWHPGGGGARWVPPIPICRTR